MTRPWTEAETRRLRAAARKRVGAQDIAKALGRHVGPVKRKARELGLILFKKGYHKVAITTSATQIRGRKTPRETLQNRAIVAPDGTH